MAILKDKVTNALDETRMLIPGAQVLLGFQVNATFRPRFAAGLALAGFMALWFLYPLLTRITRHMEARQHLRGKAGNDARQ